MRESDFRALFDQVSNWGRWSERPERGALNHLTPERVAEAARLVRTGITVTLSLPLDTEKRIDNPEPADHHMTMLTDHDIGSGSVRFTKDYVGVEYHNDGHSHIDAFSHVAYEGHFYNGTDDANPQLSGARAAGGSAPAPPGRVRRSGAGSQAGLRPRPTTQPLDYARRLPVSLEGGGSQWLELQT